MLDSRNYLFDTYLKMSPDQLVHACERLPAGL
jgi:hypothetical protein